MSGKSWKAVDDVEMPSMGEAKTESSTKETDEMSNAHSVIIFSACNVLISIVIILSVAIAIVATTDHQNHQSGKDEIVKELASGRMPPCLSYKKRGERHIYTQGSMINNSRTHECKFRAESERMYMCLKTQNDDVGELDKDAWLLKFRSSRINSERLVGWNPAWSIVYFWFERSINVDVILHPDTTCLSEKAPEFPLLSSITSETVVRVKYVTDPKNNSSGKLCADMKLDKVNLYGYTMEGLDRLVDKNYTVEMNGSGDIKDLQSTFTIFKYEFMRDLNVDLATIFTPVYRTNSNNTLATGIEIVENMGNYKRQTTWTVNKPVRVREEIVQVCYVLQG